jgi:chromosome segregation ATPase
VVASDARPNKNNDRDSTLVPDTEEVSPRDGSGHDFVEDRSTALIPAAQRQRLERLVRFRNMLDQGSQPADGAPTRSLARQGQLESFQSVLANFEDEIERYARLEADNHELRQVVTNLKHALGKEQEARKVEEARALMFSSRIQETRVGLQKAQVEIATQTAALSAARAREEALRGRLKNRDAECENLQDVEHRLLKENADLAKKLSYSKGRLATAEQQLADAKETGIQLNALLEDGANQRENLITELEAARHNMAELRSDKDDLENRISLLNSDLHANASRYDAEIRKKNMDANVALSEIDTLKRQDRERRQECGHLEAQVRTLQDEIAAEQDTNASLNELVHEERRGFEREREQFTRIASRLTAQDAKIAELASKLSGQRDAERSALSQLKRQEKENSDLQRQIRKLAAIEGKYERLKMRFEKRKGEEKAGTDAKAGKPRANRRKG